MRCFVIGPIGDELAELGSPERRAWERSVEVFEKVVEPACVAVNLEALRADRMSRPGEIPEQVVRELRDAPVVVADLTNANPNVMYELGLRHTCDRLTVQIGERGHLPFDINVIRTIQFNRTPSGLIDARNRLTAALASGLTDGYDLVTATRVWLDRGTAGQIAEFNADVHDSKGTLELLADMERAFGDVGATLNRINETTEQLGDQATEYTRRLEASDAQGRGARGRLAVVLDYAQAVHPLVEAMEELSQEFAAEVDDIEPGLLYLLDAAEKDPSQVDQAPEFLPSMVTLGETAASSISSLESFRESVAAIENVSSRLRPTVRRLRAALQRNVDSMRKTVSWGERARQLSEG